LYRCAFVLIVSLVASTLINCSSASTPTAESLADPTLPAIAGVEAAALQTNAPALPTPTLPNILTGATSAPPAPASVPGVTATLGPRVNATATRTLTPAPTTPPPLPLRDDLEPLTLQDWPRPAEDNGLGIHFIASGYYDEQELDKQIARIQALGLKWATVVYADENHLELAARKFSEAGIMVLWRKTLRPYQRYSSWGRDIEILKKYNMPPYMQLYNEPELPAEWDDRPMDYSLYFSNLLAAAKDVYNAGGYPGIQFLDEDNLRHFIDEIYARKGEALFHRMFFIPHAYGLNHPPDYQEDPNSALGFRAFATIFFRRLGFVPPFIVGEGGWKIKSVEDNRFPAIDDALHRDYTLAVFDWFRSGRLSHGGPLPDYLFAFNMWMLAGADEAGAWYDSFEGDRALTIEAVSQSPPFTRKFSWDN
jgi:hypothetical protein